MPALPTTIKWNALRQITILKKKITSPKIGIPLSLFNQRVDEIGNQNTLNKNILHIIHFVSWINFYGFFKF